MYVSCPSFVPGRAAISRLCGICRLERGWPALTLCPVFAHRCGAECGSRRSAASLERGTAFVISRRERGETGGGEGEKMEEREGGKSSS